MSLWVFGFCHSLRSSAVLCVSAVRLLFSHDLRRCCAVELDFAWRMRDDLANTGLEEIMQTRAALGGFAALVLGSYVCAADGAAKKVDFSGHWILDAVKSKIERTAPQGGGSPSVGAGNPGSYPGGGYPGGGYPPGGYPGGGYPPGGYPPGGYPPGGYPPGGGNPGGMPPGGDRRGGASPGMRGGLMDAEIIIEQTASELKVKHLPAAGSEEEQEFVQLFLLDGGESVNPSMPPGSEFRSRTRWNKDKLVTLGTEGPPNEGVAARMIIKQEMELSRDGKTLTVKTTYSGSAGGLNSKAIYTRRAGDSPKAKYTIA